VHDLTNEQLTYSGVFEAVIIMQNGYPFRLSLTDFRSFYHMLIPQTAYRKLIFHLKLFEKFCADMNLLANTPQSIMDFPLDEAAVTAFVAKNESIVFGGGASSKKGAKLNTSQTSREQLFFMVRLISQLHPKIDQRKCFVGRTKVFYRAQEHRLLLDTRMDKIAEALLLLQRQTRRYIARKLVGRILLEERNAIQCIKARNLEKLNVATSTMVEFANRLTASNKLQASIKIVDICREYTAALNKERLCEKKMVEIWNEKDKKNQLSPEEEEFLEERIYNQLQQYLTDAKSIHFQATHKGIALSLHWEENKILKAMVEKITILGQFVNMKMRYTKGLREQNELLLETCRKQYEQLKHNAINYSSKFCEAYDKEADKIIEKARQAYEELMKKVITVMPQGRFVQRSVRATDFFSMTSTSGGQMIDFEVNPHPLNDLVQEYYKIYKNDATKKKPFKVESLIVTCENIVLLRRSAGESQWKECLELIQTRWANAIEQDRQGGGEITANISEERMNNLLSGKEFYIPQEIYQHLLSELRQLIITSIYFIVIPRLNAYILKDLIPEIPFYFEPCPINTADFEKQLVDIRSYENYFEQRSGCGWDRIWWAPLLLPS
jgi:myosin heavy subunit